MSIPVDLRRHWTVDELSELPDDEYRYELVDGHLVVTPPPRQKHQLSADDLSKLLAASAPKGWRVTTELSPRFSV